MQRYIQGSLLDHTCDYEWILENMLTEAFVKHDALFLGATTGSSCCGSLVIPEFVVSYFWHNKPIDRFYLIYILLSKY